MLPLLSTPHPWARTYNNTFSPSRYQLAFPFKPAADSVTTLDSNCTSRSCLIELTRSRNWCHLTHWSWETMRQNASCPPSPPFPPPPVSYFLPSDSSAHSFDLPCYCLWITRFIPHFFHHLSLSAFLRYCHFLWHSFQGWYRDVVIKYRI